MKVPPKSLSSPGRTDDFPPPLMRFPRSKSNRGSRSRANPMFLRKINTVIDASQEPSSPKVTCIGQVRVKRSKNKQTTTSGTTGVCRCKWIRKLKPRWFLCVCRINLSYFRCDCCRTSENLPVPKSKRIEANEGSEFPKRETGDVIRPDNKILLTESPPRNALLLTRSRSAPYRSSSLASKFWESTMENREDDETGEKVVWNTGVSEGADAGMTGKGNEEEEEGRVAEFKGKPLNLSRCRSEPARTGDRLFTSFSS